MGANSRCVTGVWKDPSDSGRDAHRGEMGSCRVSSLVKVGDYRDYEIERGHVVSNLNGELQEWRLSVNDMLFLRLERPHTEPALPGLGGEKETCCIGVCSLHHMAMAASQTLSCSESRERGVVIVCTLAPVLAGGMSGGRGTSR